MIGCAGAPKPFRGGAARAALSNGTAAQVEAPEAPDTPTSQSVEREVIRDYAPPPPSPAPKVELSEVDPAAPRLAPIPAPAAPILLREHIIERAAGHVGTAAKDNSRELSARLAAARPIQWAGILLIVAAAAMFHPVVRLAVGAGKQMQIATAAAGAFLVFAPQILAGNERLALILAAAGLIIFWLSSRLSYKEASADSLAKLSASAKTSEQ